MITPKGIKTRNKIVDSATKLFMDNSITDITVSDICSQVTIAKGTFYAYFKSKDDLIWHIIEREIKGSFSVFENFLASEKQVFDLDQVVDALIDYIENNKATLKLVHDVKFYSYIGKDNIIKRYYTEAKTPEPIYQWLKQGKAAGQFDYLDLDFTAYFLSCVVDEILDEIFLDNLPYSIDVMRKNLKYMLKKILEVKHDS